mmetsp:Transcript_122918/g.382675  ORF Transcript_122918/g.382675 Transcript_122918/m.382675 type:complete len:213 (-) Transcript_122918:157-795(-)
MRGVPASIASMRSTKDASPPPSSAAAPPAGPASAPRAARTKSQPAAEPGAKSGTTNARTAVPLALTVSCRTLRTEAAAAKSSDLDAFSPKACKRARTAGLDRALAQHSAPGSQHAAPSEQGTPGQWREERSRDSWHAWKRPTCSGVSSSCSGRPWPPSRYMGLTKLDRPPSGRSPATRRSRSWASAQKPVSKTVPRAEPRASCVAAGNSNAK